MKKAAAATVLAFFAAIGPARADQAPYVGSAVAAAVETVIVPAYEDFARRAEAAQSPLADLCDAPGPETLAAAVATTVDLVDAFAAIEPYRFGPARDDNRFERLFFWPDPRGRALRQVQGVLASKDPTAVDLATLQQKSVAVQGLLALDFVLAGDGSAALADPASDPYRCAYAKTIGAAIADTAVRMRDGWTGQTGFAQALLEPGPGAPVFRSDAEAMQALLDAAREQLSLTAGLKLEAILGDGPKAAKPRLAPFWRSGGTLAMLRGNVAAVRALTGAWKLDDLLTDEAAGLGNALATELHTAADALAALPEDRDFIAIARDVDGHARLSFVVLPLKGAEALIGGEIAGGLGLIAGFNSLDGD